MSFSSRKQEKHASTKTPSTTQFDLCLFSLIFKLMKISFLLSRSLQFAILARMVSNSVATCDLNVCRRSRLLNAQTRRVVLI